MELCNFTARFALGGQHSHQWCYQIKDENLCDQFYVKNAGMHISTNLNVCSGCGVCAWDPARDKCLIAGPLVYDCIIDKEYASHKKTCNLTSVDDVKSALQEINDFFE